MKSLQCIPLTDNQTDSDLSSRKSRDAKNYYELISPKSTLQLKLKQMMYKSKGDSNLEDQFQILRKAHERSIKALAQKEGELDYFRTKIIFLSEKQTIYQKTMKDVAESLQKMCRILQINNFSISQDFSIDGDDSSFIEEYHISIVSCLQEIQKKFVNMTKKQNKEEKGQNKSNQFFLQKLKMQNHDIFKKNQSLEKKVFYLEDLTSSLEKKLQENSVRLEFFEKEEKEFEELMEGIDIKLKNRKELIFILKGLSKRHRRLEKECKIKKDKVLKADDLEEYVRYKEKNSKQPKKQTSGKVLDFQ